MILQFNCPSLSQGKGENIYNFLIYSPKIAQLDQNSFSSKTLTLKLVAEDAYAQFVSLEKN